MQISHVYAYDQMAPQVYLCCTQDTIESISFAQDLLVTVTTPLHPNLAQPMFLCFEI